MKLTTSVLILALAASASAQSKGQAAPAKPAAKPAATTTTAKPAVAAPAAKAAPAKVTPAKATSAKPVAKTKKAAKQAKAVDAKAPEMARVNNRARGRDPFKTIIQDRAGMQDKCTGTGKQCLIPSQLALKGVVRSSSGFIAVVTTSENRAYFLREKDPVFNGMVVRITEGSIIFQEHGTDMFGKSVSKEVVKKINPSAA